MAFDLVLRTIENLLGIEGVALELTPRGGGGERRRRRREARAAAAQDWGVGAPAYNTHSRSLQGLKVLCAPK